MEAALADVAAAALPAAIPARRTRHLARTFLGAPEVGLADVQQATAFFRLVVDRVFQKAATPAERVVDGHTEFTRRRPDGHPAPHALGVSSEQFLAAQPG